jgi:hypothetical protein
MEIPNITPIKISKYDKQSLKLNSMAKTSFKIFYIHTSAKYVLIYTNQ